MQSFSSFFSRSPKRTAIFDDVVKRRLPRAVITRWNFKSQMVNTLYEYQNFFRDCLEKIINEDPDSKTISEASGLLKHLTCSEILYWLKIFHLIMPHVDIFFNQVQTRGIESVQIQNAIEQFERQIIRIRSVINNLEQEGVSEESAKRRQKVDDIRSVVAKEVCDNILIQI